MTESLALPANSLIDASPASSDPAPVELAQEINVVDLKVRFGARSAIAGQGAICRAPPKSARGTASQNSSQSP